MSAQRTDRVLLVVTGIQAAGKSTVARLLAARFQHGVHVEADALQRMIVSGAEGVRGPGPPQGEAARQLRLRLRHMCLLGRSFFDNGFTAVLDDIIIGERWTELQEELAGYPFTLVVLAPRVQVVAEGRDLTRTKQPLGPAWAIYLDGELRRTMTGIGLWVDSSAHTAAETVDEILSRLPPAGDPPP